MQKPLGKKLSRIKTPSPLPPFFFFFKLYLDSQAHLVLVFCLFFDSWFFGDFSVSGWVLTSYFIEFLFSLHLYPGSEVRVLKCEITILSELWVTVCLRKEITFALFLWLSMNHFILFICFIHWQKTWNKCMCSSVGSYRAQGKEIVFSNTSHN